MRISDILHSKDVQKSGITEPEKDKEIAMKIRSSRTILSRTQSETSVPTQLISSERKPVSTHLYPAISAITIYGNLVQQARNFLSGLSKDPVQFPDLEEICEVIERISEGIESQPARFLELVKRSTPDDYLPGEIANVTILSIALSHQLNWSMETQRAVGMGAFLHNAGMTFYRLSHPQSTPPSPEEEQSLRKLPQKSLEILGTFLASFAPEPKKIVENIILQSQERISGQGYPHELKGDQISKEAQVVGLCNTYESITHPYPHRRQKLPHEALKYLIELCGETFDGSLVKALWETLSLFPPGSFVHLNTGEIAKVTNINKKLPAKPIVKVIVSSAGEKVRKEKIIDLSQTSSVTIEKSIDECTLHLSDRRLLLELRAQRWWLK